MEKKRIYAVKRGREKGIFYDWNECQEYVKYFPNREWKKFKTEEKAREWLDQKDDSIKYETQKFHYSFNKFLTLRENNIKEEDEAEHDDLSSPCEKIFEDIILHKSILGKQNSHKA